MKTTRPNLAFITSQNFKSWNEYTHWYCNLTDDQQEIVNNFRGVNLPQLIACTEMLFDANLNNQDSVVFKFASETLIAK